MITISKKPKTAGPGNSGPANQNQNMKTIHEALNLPKRYRVGTSVTGQLRIGPNLHDSRLVELKLMRTDTLGQMAVHALFKDGVWSEISGDKFSMLAKAVVNGTEVDPVTLEPKPVTNRERIDELAASCRMNPLRFYVLEMALLKACGFAHGSVKVASSENPSHYVLPGETPGYQKESAALDDLLASLKTRK